MQTTAPLNAKSVAALYDTDLYAWANTNAELLRQGKYEQIDVAHLIEEIEDMGKSEFRAFESHLQNLLKFSARHRLDHDRRIRRGDSQRGRSSTMSTLVRSSLTATSKFHSLLLGNSSPSTGSMRTV